MKKMQKEKEEKKTNFQDLGFFPFSVFPEWILCVHQAWIWLLRSWLGLMDEPSEDTQHEDMKMVRREWITNETKVKGSWRGK